MLLIAVLAAAFGWVAHRARVQHAAVVAIVLGGGHARYDYQLQKTPGGDILFEETARPGWPRWLFDRLGPDYLATVEGVELGPHEPDWVMAHVGRLGRLRVLQIVARGGPTDAGMIHLRGLTRMEELWFLGRDGRITGASLANLKKMSRLRTLVLPDNLPMTDADLASLSGLISLKSLMLDSSGITDAGLAHLEPLVNINLLRLNCNRVTGAGLAHLRGMSELQVLNLLGTRVDTLAPISHLEKLEDLDVDSGLISNADLMRLVGLKHLQSLSINKSAVLTEEGIAALRRARPDLKILAAPDLPDILK